MTGRRSHGRLSALNGVVHQGTGKPLDSYDTILNYLRTTRTSTGLRVRAHLVRRSYVKGIKIAAADMNTLALEELEPLPAWNYTLQPRC